MWPTRVACARAHVYEILANNFIAVTNAHTRAHKHIYILPFISARTTAWAKHANMFAHSTAPKCGVPAAPRSSAQHDRGDGGVD